MIAGELDISVGSMVPAGSMTTAIIAGHYGMPISVAVAAVLLLGVTIGLINGNLVVRAAVPSFIVTLGTLFAVAGTVLGLSVIITGTTSVAIKATQLAKAIFGDLYFGKQLQVFTAWWLVDACPAHRQRGQKARSGGYFHHASGHARDGRR